MRLVWDKSGEHFYETGVDHGVVYPMTGGTYEAGEAWNGLTAVNETPSGGEATALYADNIKYLNLMSVEELGLSIEAYTYPDKFAECDGTKEIKPGVMIGQQNRKHFGFTYRSMIGNDEEGTDLGYKLHLVYGCLASPTEKNHSTVNDSPEADTFSWDVTTTPIAVENFKPSASLTIDSRKVPANVLKQIEDLLYGSADSEPTLPTPDAIVALFPTEEQTGGEG